MWKPKYWISAVNIRDYLRSIRHLLCDDSFGRPNQETVTGKFLSGSIEIVRSGSRGSVVALSIKSLAPSL
jgi:hypothetical protein